MDYRFRPFLFGDVVKVLSDAEESPRLHQRIAGQPVSSRWWVLDEAADSYLFGLDAQVREDGPGYLLYFNGQFFEIGAELFGNQVAFREGVGTPKSAGDDVKAAFSEAIRVYGRGGQGPMRPDDIPLDPVFVSALLGPML